METGHWRCLTLQRGEGREGTRLGTGLQLMMHKGDGSNSHLKLRLLPAELLLLLLLT